MTTTSTPTATGSCYYKAGVPTNVYIPGDQVIEHAGEGQLDRVFATVDYTLPDNVERLTLDRPLWFRRISRAPAIGANVITGNAGSNQLAGLGGGDVLDGGAGADVMLGGTGDDTYHVDLAASFTWLGNYGLYLPGDEVIEDAGAGTDTVISTISYTLPMNVEKLVLGGASAIDGTGNGLANTITGNSAANTLDGGAGADAMIGGAGHDRYLVDHAGDQVIEAAAKAPTSSRARSPSRSGRMSSI